ncbi:E3 SUMO-protein ligase pli1 [Knufia fluminis]|uniref:E3 SUMO-protein ligase pli1 n=1 Tax=Knufia fluminis TaxID=191047 RepID=A0AAN8EDF8_9EURO|nr:E3 SUMO-protein ligase pli1 [Knufia fluminis]
MASMSGAHTVQGDLVRGILAEVNTLTVDRLKRALKAENLTVSGLKNELQIRLRAHIHDCDRNNDQVGLRRIKDAVRGYPSAQNSTTYNSNPYPSPYSNHTPASSASPQNYYNSPTPRLPPPPSLAMPTVGYNSSRITFKDSPFYKIQKQLSNVVELKPREQTRDTARLTVNLDEALATRFQADSSCRAMVFCAAESFDSAWKPVEIAFPHHAEIRCNQDELKVNLKGLKNKPGSTRPVDITPFLRKKAGFPNNVELVYALTNKGANPQKYLLLVNLVQKKSIDTLVEDLKRGKYLSKARVIQEMMNRANDDDIVVESSKMSLRDPVQMTRIETPCRSIGCKHNECFDAAVYLALQEQAPTWTCPICNRPAQWDNLVYDQFVEEILRNTHKDIEQVTIEPDGRWHVIKTEEDEPKPKTPNPFSNHHDSDDDDDDDDLIEITDIDAPKTTASIRTRPSADSIRTPSLNGRDSFPPPPTLSSASLAQSIHQPPTTQSKKRPREEVIDLTLSDDDEQPPVSRIKRPSLSSQISDSNRSGVPGAFRFTLPPPVPSRTSTNSPANWYSPGNYYDYDVFHTRL